MSSSTPFISGPSIHGIISPQLDRSLNHARRHRVELKPVSAFVRLGASRLFKPSPTEAAEDLSLLDVREGEEVGLRR